MIIKKDKNVFIGMKCNLDGLEPKHNIIEDNVIISDGYYFTLHGKRQKHSSIKICKGSYIVMRSKLNGAASLVNEISHQIQKQLVYQ